MVLADARAHGTLDSPTSLAAATQLGDLYRRIGQGARAESTLRDVVTRMRRSKDSDPGDRDFAINDLALVLRDEPATQAESDSLFRESIAGQAKRLGPGHYETLSARLNRARLLLNMGRHSEAEAELRRILEDGRATIGVEGDLSTQAQVALGDALKGEKRFDEAIAVYREAERVMRKPGNTSRSLGASVLNRSGALEAVGQGAVAIRELTAFAEEQRRPAPTSARCAMCWRCSTSRACTPTAANARPRSTACAAPPTRASTIPTRSRARSASSRCAARVRRDRREGAEQRGQRSDRRGAVRAAPAPARRVTTRGASAASPGPRAAAADHPLGDHDVDHPARAHHHRARRAFGLADEQEPRCVSTCVPAPMLIARRVSSTRRALRSRGVDSEHALHDRERHRRSEHEPLDVHGDAVAVGPIGERHPQPGQRRQRAAHDEHASCRAVPARAAAPKRRAELERTEQAERDHARHVQHDRQRLREEACVSPAPGPPLARLASRATPAAAGTRASSTSSPGTSHALPRACDAAHRDTQRSPAMMAISWRRADVLTFASDSPP